MASPLEHLAWSSLTERVIVARVANKLLREGKGLANRGIVKRIKEAVRETCPPHGFLGRRCNAVPNEMRRQAEVREARRRFRPYKEPQWSASDRRRMVASARLGINCSRCHEVRVLQGFTLYLIQSYISYSWPAFVVRRSCDGKLDLIEVDKRATTIGDALVRLHGNEISRALVRGARVSFDAPGLRTVLHYDDGSTASLEWPISNKLLKRLKKSAQRENSK